MRNRRYISFMIAWIIPGLMITGQVITVDPEYPTINDEVTITFNRNACDCNLESFTGDIYAHTGVITTSSSSENDWKHVVTEWGENTPETKLTKINDSLYRLLITPDAKTYYTISEGETVLKFAFVFRNPTGSQQSSNIYQDVYQPGLSIVITDPVDNIIVKESDDITITANAVSLGTPVANSISLFVDSELVHVAYGSILNHQISASGTGKHWIKLLADNSDFQAVDSLFYFIRKDIVIEDVPANLVEGINYIDENSVTLVLYAPHKNDVFVIGDFNNWELNNDYLMKRSTDGKRYWLTLTDLTAGEEYAFQYLVDGNIRIADPYTEKILDPVNDPGIPASTYPDLKAYPTNKTTGIVSILQTSQVPYTWENVTYKIPLAEELVIYEMLIRDFVAARNIKTITDTLDYLESLGINAIELMPVNEFEGNESWGYNPSFYFAFDKYYGRKQDLQKFVEECHKRGIAVIIDMVLNHSYSQSPLVQMYLNDETGAPTTQSPWYNQSCPHQPWCWGFDFNHESEETKKFVDRVNRFWLTEYNIDGFRFDFTKGFTNKVGDGWAYDASRIAILKRMTDSIRAVKNDAIVIFEHLADNTEEKELAEYGILLWGNMNFNYNEATMGYHESNKSNLSGISYQQRNWTVPHLVGYMESHDEERLMYKNITYGASSDDYNTKDFKTALNRMETAAAFFFTVPGPKMIWQFGEIGYENSINRCTDGSISDNCRLSPKPLPWNDMNEPRRIRLKGVFSEIINLRNEHGIFQTKDFDLNVHRAMKSIHLNSSDTNVTIIGNFDLTSGKIDPEFQHTGTWYDYFGGTSLEVDHTNDSILLEPGEYRIYIDKMLETPQLPSDIRQSRISNQNEYIIYPNPADDFIVIHNRQSEGSEIIFTLMNMLGQKILEKQYILSGNQTQTINISDLTIQNTPLLFQIDDSRIIYSGLIIIN